MKKTNKAEKRLTICIPDELCEKFQQVCDFNYKSMSEALRDFIKSYISDYTNRLEAHIANKSLCRTSGKIFVVTVQDDKGDLHEQEVFTDLSAALQFEKKMNVVYANGDWQIGLLQHDLNIIARTLSTKEK